LQEIIEKMHREDYVHGDLRPPNILCDKIMLLDFDWGESWRCVLSTPATRPHPQLTTGRSLNDDRVLGGTLEYMQEITTEMEE
ncbi:hypothetical protein EV363DRAFT_1153665, partial [Boletus edulis]